MYTSSAFVFTTYVLAISIQQCLNRPTTCASWVYKFSTPNSVVSGKRTCTLYSQFNLPSQVTIEIDLNNANNQNINAAEIMANGNNPQAGGLVPQSFKDLNLNTVPDTGAFSGPVWATRQWPGSLLSVVGFIEDRSPRPKHVRRDGERQFSVTVMDSFADSPRNRIDQGQPMHEEGQICP